MGHEFYFKVEQMLEVHYESYCITPLFQRGLREFSACSNVFVVCSLGGV